MRRDKNLLARLAANRRARTGADGRPRFGLRRDEIEQSTYVAMRLAHASKSQVADRQPDACSSVA